MGDCDGLSPNRVAIISTIESPITVLLAFSIFGDELTSMQFFGSILVVSSIFWNVVSSDRSNSEVLVD